MNEFKLGDVVVLKGNTEEPKMTITKLQDEFIVACTYFNKEAYKFQYENLLKDSIELFEEKKLGL